MANEAQIAGALAYIETHLTGPLTLQEVARAAGYSPFHFHRLFLAITGETPAAYIRRRRLSESARVLAQSGRRAVDVALEYQYDSQEAFIRAFRRAFGVTPGQYRRGFAVSSQPGQPPHLAAPGGSSMQPRIVEMAPFSVVGMIYFGENQKAEIGQLWTEFNLRIPAIAHRKPEPGAYGICFMDERANPNFWYLAGVAVEQLDDMPLEMVGKRIPAHTYVVFTHRGPVATLSETYTAAYSNWLPSSGYELAAPLDFEHYDERFNLDDPAKSEVDIYIPIRPKAM
jgi:AraC family transcriptional regulator